VTDRTPQPVPDVSDADVERIVRRDFAPTDADETLSLLRTYGTETWEREIPRVRVAILRLAAGDVGSLRQYLTDAKRDYRDVLLGAEYLEYAALTLKTPQPASEAARRAIEADWVAYQDWLHG